MVVPLQHFPEFPFRPYPSQLGFMSSLYYVLQQGGIGLLESPTGTGKTISIIASALQWLEDHRRRQQEAVEQAQQTIAEVAAASSKDEPEWVVQAAVSMVLKQSQLNSNANDAASSLSAIARRARAKAKKLRQSSVMVQDLGSGPANGNASKVKSGDTAADEDLFLLADAASNQHAANEGITQQQARASLCSSDDEDNDAQNATAKQPQKTQIIFCSRTHSQLSQFVGELKRTQFGSRLSMVVLAARKVVCINRVVNNLGPAPLINQQCLDMQQACRWSLACIDLAPQKLPKNRKRGNAGQVSGCPYLQHEGELLQQWEDEVLSQPLDVEELVDVSKSLGVCPYYAGRSALQHADVVLAPYSCVLQPGTREALGLQLQRAVLIIDEAHNLVDALHSMHSVAVTGSQLAAAQSILAVYIARVGCRLSAHNAQHVQLLQRMLRGLQNALQAGQPQQLQQAGVTQQQMQQAGAPQQSQQTGRAHALGTAGATDGDSNSSAGRHPSTTANVFLLQHELDDINLFQLLKWVQGSKLMLKLAGYSMWQADVARQETASSSAAGRSIGKMSSSSIKSEACALRSEQLGALHACVAFLAALTHADADGRVLCTPCHAAQPDNATPCHAAQPDNATPCHAAQPDNATPCHAAQPDNATPCHAAQPDNATPACASSVSGNSSAGRPAQQPGTRRDEQDADSLSSGCLKYVSLNAAAHFGKVMSQCHAVVLASGTLSPVEGVLGQLFNGNGLQLLREPRLLPFHACAVTKPVGCASMQHSAQATSCSTSTAVSATVADSSSNQNLVVLGNISRPCEQQQQQQHPLSLLSATGISTCVGPSLPAQEISAALTCAQATSDRQPWLGVDTGSATRPVLHYACGHVVPSDQLLVLVAGSGPTGIPLELRHANRTVPSVMDEVGRLLVNTCRAVPGGVVVFVPSFAYLTQLWLRWHCTGMLATLQQRKAVFQEPRSSAEVDATLQAYASAIKVAAADAARQHGRQAGSAADLGVQASKGSQEAAHQVTAAGQTGALLLAVVGGKLSEGINFADDLGRCVVVLGLPYANPTDPELIERKAYLDAQNKTATRQKAHWPQQGQMQSGADACSIAQPRSGITGQQLYEGMCMNAVNQCVGRVIRHAKDWACVLLVDARYVKAGVGAAAARCMTAQPLPLLIELARKQAPLSRLPAWMLQSLQGDRQDFGYCYSKLTAFMKSQATLAS